MTPPGSGTVEARGPGLRGAYIDDASGCRKRAPNAPLVRVSGVVVMGPRGGHVPARGQGGFPGVVAALAAVLHLELDCDVADPHMRHLLLDAVQHAWMRLQVGDH